MKKVIFIGICCCLVKGFVSQSEAKQTTFQWRPCKPSQQNIIQSARFEWHDEEILFKFHNQNNEIPEIRDILAILVEFQTDEDDRTTGDGRFDISVPHKSMIDSPPHDIDYFNTQLKAMTNYFQSVSQERLILNCHVFDQILTLEHEMGYYNPGMTDELTDQGLAKLFYDAIRLGDSKDIRFSDYDYIFIFHAGVGRDIDLGYDITPSDIPSAFLNINDLQEFVDEKEWVAGKGIPVENGTHYIGEGIVLPETESQEGIQIGLLGTMTIMFGFQLGLPALWNTRTGQSGIGRWGLMDQGSGNFYGLIPAEPCAWSKIFLGWEDPIEIQTGTDLLIACSKVKDGNRIYKIPINDHEYFLIENRLYDPIRNDIDGSFRDSVTVGWDRNGNQTIFLQDGQLSDTLDVIVRVEEYDYGLPGSGILIWHIDEDVIREKFSENTINNDKNHRGVDLEEADGAQDIGELYGFFSGGAGSETGVMHDAWYRDNEINLLVNESDSVAFTPDSYPNCRSYTGANSHIMISNFSKIDTIMTFSVKSDLLVEGYPVRFGQDQEPIQILYGNIDQDELVEIILATEGGNIYAWNLDGTCVESQNLFEFHTTFNGDTLWFPSARLVQLPSNTISDVVVGNVLNNTPESDEIVFTTRSNLFYIFKPMIQEIISDSVLSPDDEITFLLVTKLESVKENKLVIIGTRSGGVYQNSDLLWKGSSSIVGLAIVPSEKLFNLVVTTENGDVVLIDSEGQEIWFQPLSNGQGMTIPAVAQLDPNESYATIVLSENQGIIYSVIDGKEIYLSEGFFPSNPTAPAIGDIDGDGFMEIVFTAHGQVWAFNHNGSLVNYFPIPAIPRDFALSNPILGDVDGNGQIDILTVTSQGDLEAYSYNGTMVKDFPISTGRTMNLIPALIDMDNQGDMGLLTVSDKGFVYLWDLPGQYTSDSVPWGSYLHDPAHTGFNPQQLKKSAPLSDFFPKNLAYNYPNPTEGNFTMIRYRLEETASVWIKIFDLAGDLIDEFEGPGASQTENEVIWDLTDVESGVYFCQVKATSGEMKKTAVFKIGVVK